MPTWPRRWGRRGPAPAAAQRLGPRSRPRLLASWGRCPRPRPAGIRERPGRRSQRRRCRARRSCTSPRACTPSGRARARFRPAERRSRYRESSDPRPAQLVARERSSPLIVERTNRAAATTAVATTPASRRIQRRAHVQYRPRSARRQERATEPSPAPLAPWTTDTSRGRVRPLLPFAEAGVIRPMPISLGVVHSERLVQAPRRGSQAGKAQPCGSLRRAVVCPVSEDCPRDRGEYG